MSNVDFNTRISSLDQNTALTRNDRISSQNKSGSIDGDIIRQVPTGKLPHIDRTGNSTAPLTTYGSVSQSGIQDGINTNDPSATTKLEELSEIGSLFEEISDEAETIPHSRANRLSNDDCRAFMHSQLEAAKRLSPDLDLESLATQANSFSMPTKGEDKIDNKELKHSIKQFTKDVKKALDAHAEGLSAKLEATRHEVLAEKSIWKTGYEKADGVGWNKFTPLASLDSCKEAAGIEARTCHAHTTEQPINAWKTSYSATEKGATGVFYRNGSFAPQPSKLGEKWSTEQKQDVANQRAETMAKALVADFIKTHPGKTVDQFTFSNLNLMSRFHGEEKLTSLHKHALDNLNGRTINVTVDGQTHSVKLEVRAWRQDIKDASYFSNTSEMKRSNKAALASLDQALTRLGKSDSVPRSELADMKKLRDVIGRQLSLQERPGMARLFFAIGRGLGNLIGGTYSNPKMDPSEVSALIIALESKIGEHENGAISEGCKSGKDRGSIVDVAAKALLHEIAANNGRVPSHVLQPGWMLNKATNDEDFRLDIQEIFLANYDLQQANTGFKGYITSDSYTTVFGKVGARNYIDKLSDLVMEDRGAIKAGSRMIKS